MATITLRQANVVSSTGGTVKGTPLTNAEVDNNFANLNVVANNLDANTGPVTDLTTNFKGNIVYAIRELRGNLTSSAGLATLLGDETGTGFVVYSASPSLTGTPQAVTAANGTANLMIATTQFVNNEINDSPTITNGTLAGTPQSVTAANGTSNSMVATTQFVTSAIRTSPDMITPTMSSPSITGTPQSVTAANATSNAMVATTQFVNNQIAASPTINGPTINLGTSNFLNLVNPTLVSAFEMANIRNEVPPTTIDVSVLDPRGTVIFFTSNATSNVTVNIRANASTSLDSWLGSTSSNANTATVVIMMQTGATPYYVQNVNIDGRVMSNATIKGNLFWQGNTLTIGGTANTIEVYSFTVVKNGGTRGGVTYGGNVYTILGSQTSFRSQLQ